MGCDIHLYIERKVKNKWCKIEIDKRLLPDCRNYHLFSFLANVRSNGKMIAQFHNRGIPNDCSLESAGTDDCNPWLGEHSFTYAYIDEILKAPWKENELQQCYFFIFFQYVLPRICNFVGILNDEEKINIRVIMGFDN